MESKATEDVEKVTLRISPPLAHRIEALISEESLGFVSLEHFLQAGLHSFVSFKEKQLARLRGDARRQR